MKRTWKQIGSLFLAFCMVFTMLPTVAFAEGAPITISNIAVTGLTEPVVGEEPDTDKGNLSITEGVSINAIEWLNASTSDFMQPAEKFAAGTTYICVIYFKANPEYVLPSYLPFSSVTLNGREPKGIGFGAQTPPSVLTATFNFTLSAGPTISNFVATRTSVSTVEYSFTPSTAGTYGVVLLKKDSQPPVYINMGGTMSDTSKVESYINGNFTYQDPLILYLQIENGDEVKSVIYSLEPSAHNAQPPNITGHPAGAVYTQGAAAAALSVTVDPLIYGGTLSYQWYAGGMAVDGAVNSSYTPPTGASSIGITNYHCVVTNTNSSAAGNKTATATSNSAAITVNAPTGGGTTQAANATELKTELEEIDAQTITVGADIILNEAVTVGANHTLVIPDGLTLTVGDITLGSATLTVPDGKVLTVQGTGTLKAANGTTTFGITILGSLLVDGGNLTVSNTGQNTNGVAAAGLLKIQNSGHLQVENSGQNTGVLCLGLGSVTIEDSTAAIANSHNDLSDCFGIHSYSLIIDHSAVTVSSIGSAGIATSGGNIQIINGSQVTLTPGASGSGIFYGANSGSLLVDASVLALLPGGGVGLSLPPTGTSFAGANGGIVRLAQGAKIEGTNGKMLDQGHVLTSSYVTVGAAGDTPSTTGLTAGDYVWDGTYFTKAAASTPLAPLANPAWSGVTPGRATWTAVPVSYTFLVQAVGDDTSWSNSPWSLESAPYVYAPPAAPVTGTMDIGGEMGKNLATNQDGAGWAWNAATATLTLDSVYSSNKAISINCAYTDTINLVYTGDVSITANNDIAFYCSGNLVANGSGGTLSLSSFSTAFNSGAT